MGKRVKTGFFIIGLGIFSLLVWDFGPVNILSNIGKTGWWFGAIIGVWLIAYLLNSLAWYYIIGKEKDSVSFLMVFCINLSSFSLNYITPFLSLGGEPYRTIAIKDRIGIHRSISSTILYNMIHILSHFFFWITGIIIIPFIFPISTDLLLVLFFSFFILSFAIFFFFTRHKQGLFKSLIKWISKIRILKPVNNILLKHNKALSIIDAYIIELYINRRISFYKALLLEYLARIITAFEFYFILYSIGIEISIFQACYIHALSSLILNILFFIPMEIGAREGGLYFVLENLHLLSGIGIYVALINRIRELFWIFIGLILIDFKDYKKNYKVKTKNLFDIIETEK